METWLEDWIKKNGYELYAEAKGYRIYENDKYTIVLHETEGLKMMKEKNKNPSKGEILFSEDGWVLLSTSPCGIQLWEKYGLYVYYHPKFDIFSKMYIEHPKEVFKKYGVGGLK